MIKPLRSIFRATQSHAASPGAGFLAAVLMASAALLVTAGNALAANHAKAVTALGTGPFPVACSNMTHNEALMNQIGGQPADFWEGNDDNGKGRYVTQILAEPQAALQFNLNVPDDRGLYEHFAGDTLPMAILACYPTSAVNNRADYRLPGGQVLPRMERTGDLPIFPADIGQYPVVVYSHGLGGSPLSDDYLGTITQLASHGYIVMAVFHGDARVTRLRISDLSGVVFLATNFDRYVELQALRPLALKRALDYLMNRPGYAGRVNPNQIGGFGASLGGEAMLLAMGARLTQNYVTLTSRPVEQDPRIKAAVGYVPYAGQSFLPAFGNDQQGADFVTRPFLALSGTADTTAPIKLAEQAVNRLKGSRYLVALGDVPHGYHPEYAADVFTWTLTFLAAHVKDDRAALSKLVNMARVEGGLGDDLRIDYTAPTPLGNGEVLVTEFYNDVTKHFINAIGQPEVDLVASYVERGWRPTGQQFKAYMEMPGVTLDPPLAAFTRPTCRFYRGNGADLLSGNDTIFLTTDATICDIGKSIPDQWTYIGSPIHLKSPDLTGQCPDGWIGIYRAYNNNLNSVNHRFTTSNAALDDVVRAKWNPEGVAMCAPL